MWHKDFIGVYENFVPQDFCNQVVNYIEQEISKGTAWDREEDSLDKKDLSVEGLNTDFSSIIFKNLLKAVKIYKSEFGTVSPILNFQDLPCAFEGMKLQKTKPGEGYHIWHCENNGAYSFSRILVWTIYLNDIEEGGETEFLTQSLRIPPTTGTLCIFPAYFTHTHRGNPPLKGTKYIATGWISHDYPTLLKRLDITSEDLVFGFVPYQKPFSQFENE